MLLPVPEPARPASTGRARPTGCATRSSRDLETTFGLEGLGDSVVVEHRMTPLDFRDELGAVDGNAFSVEPTLHQRAWFRPPNRDRRRAPGSTTSAAGRTRAPGCPGVLLGAEVTAGLVARDHPRPRRDPGGRRRAAAAA